jgi:hypothetical protein
MARDIVSCDVVIQAGHENRPDNMTGGAGPLGKERWSRLSEQIFRVDKWSLCRG